MVYRYKLHDHDKFQTRSINGIVFTKTWQEFDHKIDFGPFRLMVMEDTLTSPTDTTPVSVKPDINRMGKPTLIQYIMENTQQYTKDELRQMQRVDLVNVANLLEEK